MDAEGHTDRDDAERKVRATGRACLMGRVSKVCGRCRIEKPEADFRRRADGKTLQSYCIECGKAAGREWFRKNRDRSRENAQRWSEQNRELRREYYREYVLKNPEKERARQQKSRAKHSAKVLARQRARNARPEVKERRRAYDVARRNASPSARLAHNLRSRLHDALKRRAKRGSAVELLGCSILEAVAHIERQFKPGMSWENHGEWEFDHIRPLSAFDLTNPAQLKAACHYTNLQPLWATENKKKSSKILAPST